MVRGVRRYARMWAGARSRRCPRRSGQFCADVAWRHVTFQVRVEEGDDPAAGVLRGRPARLPGLVAVGHLRARSSGCISELAFGPGAVALGQFLAYLAHRHAGWPGRRCHRRTVPGVTIRRARNFPGRSLISAAMTARSAQSSRGLGLVRRSAATSCRSTSSAAFLDADERASRTSQPQSRTKIR